MSPSHTIRALALGCFLACPVGARGPTEDVEAAVRGLLEGVSTSSDAHRVAAELVDLGRTALDPLFAHLCRLRAQDGLDHSSLRAAALTVAFGRFPRGEVLASLERVARSSADAAQRAVALEVLGGIGEGNDLRLAIELVTPADADTPPGGALRDAFQAAFLGVHQRDARAARLLATYFERARPGVRAAIVAALGGTGSLDVLGVLAGLLGRSGSGADAILLLELGKLVDHSGGTDDLLVLERVRGFLGNPDKRLAILACVALQKLRDHQAVPDLVVMLSDRNENLRERAHAALVSLTGMDLGSDPQRWIVWLDVSFAWWAEREHACRTAILSGTPEECAAALRETAGQRLFADQVVRILALALQRPEPDLFRSACRALGGMPERGARVALARVVGHSDPNLAEQAQVALRRQDARLASGHSTVFHPRHARSISRVRTP